MREQQGDDLCRPTNPISPQRPATAPSHHTALLVLAALLLLQLGCQSTPPQALSPEQQLIAAADRGDSARVRQLLARGIAADTTIGSSNLTPLFLAAERGHAAIAALLIAHGADPNVRSDKEGFTPLIRASVQGHTDVVTLLLRSGAKINFQSDVGGTALMWATVRGQHETMQRLLSAGAAVNARGTRGESALLLAVKQQDTQAVALLLDHGANPHLEDLYDNTPLSTAREAGHSAILTLIQEQQQRIKERSI